MAVLSVTEDWRGRAGGLTVTTSVHRRRFLVVFDNADDPAIRPFLALVAVDPVTAVAVPQGLQVHPYSPWLFVTAVDYEAAGPIHYIIDITYGTRPAESCEWPTFANPLLSPWEIEWFTVEYEDRIDVAYDNQDNLDVPIVNVNGEPPDPNLTETFSLKGLRITRHEETFNENHAYQYKGAVNSDYFRNTNPWTVKCTRFDGRRVIYGNGAICWQVIYELLWNYRGWQRRIRNEGFTEKINGELVEAKIGDERVSQPVLLDSNGVKVPLGGNVHWLCFKTLRALPFSDLNLNF